MDFKRVTSSSKTYVILLIVAVAILLFTASITYKQIKRLQQSADGIALTLEIDNAIEKLFSLYARMESEKFRTVLLGEEISNSSWQDYKLAGTTAFNDLHALLENNKIQKERLDSIGQLQETFYGALNDIENNAPKKLSQEDIRKQLMSVSEILEKVRAIKDQMLLEEHRVMIQRKVDYASRRSLTPLTSLLMAFFALVVFGLSFSKIYANKRQLRASDAFLRNLLASTDNIVNYYEPVYDGSENIVDFRIVFANECNRDYLGLPPEEIMGDLVTKVFPHLSLNGEFEDLVRSFEDQTKVGFDRELSVNDNKLWFKSIVTPVSKGIMETARNVTIEKQAEEKLRSLNQELVNQNQILKDTESFLAGILRSTENVIMSFEPILDDSGFIVDFEFLFINEQIRDVLNKRPIDILGKRVSEVTPTVFSTGVFEKMVACYMEDKKMDYETSYIRNGEKMWFHGTAIKCDNSVTVTSRDITKEKKSKRKIQEVNERLRVQNSIFKDAESVASIGSYMWYLDDGSANISDNFYNILGCEPGSFEVTFDRYREFVHPDDLDIYDTLGRQTTKNGQSEVHDYRIVSKTGEVKHLHLEGRFIKRNGRPVSVGVVQDITNMVKADEDLRARNFELKRNNAELESFNRVASHDLQEPLRKIQLFLSRIDDEDRGRLREKSRNYLDKVNNAANRMQSLIRNLLTYSRIDVTHDDFEMVDLNLVIEKVEDDLAVTIKETKAKIIYEKLPTVRGVVFQMEQLFSNLISNALKYRDTKVDLKIVLNWEKVHREQIPQDFIKSNKHYHKITVLDNGIGFSSENSEKIFEVFQRLHQRTEYSGTGIGLAICKKIAENHHGFIYATGELGRGSAFIIYLPSY
ncbi:ATP-binding protein [Kriegella aquimaris]|uniref:histidine kinase n=1 Tax=Kriegella aquimaris TaxID=192904 RepID=A0A1G9UNU3_9FLAO|nr:ATP-binding protein [Kriegella aquimaris]SDM61599.1 PAS domain S-box-containing protein [Kriegella aquimaris]